MSLYLAVTFSGEVFIEGRTTCHSYDIIAAPNHNHPMIQWIPHEQIQILSYMFLVWEAVLLHTRHNVEEKPTTTSVSCSNEAEKLKNQPKIQRKQRDSSCSPANILTFCSLSECLDTRHPYWISLKTPSPS